MVTRYLNLAVFCALILVVAAAITIKIADTNTIENHTEPNNSSPSLLRHLAEKKEEQPTLANLAEEKFSFRPLEPCQCSAYGVKLNLALFNGPEPPF